MVIITGKLSVPLRLDDDIGEVGEGPGGGHANRLVGRISCGRLHTLLALQQINTVSKNYSTTVLVQGSGTFRKLAKVTNLLCFFSGKSSILFFNPEPGLITLFSKTTLELI